MLDFAEHPHRTIRIAREDFIAGGRPKDDGSLDGALVVAVHAIMADSPGETLAGCIEAVTALRGAIPDGLSDRMLAARVRLDERSQTEKDREKKRVPASIAEHARRAARGGRVAGPAWPADGYDLKPALLEALDWWEMLAAGDDREAHLVRIAELRRMVGA